MAPTPVRTIRVDDATWQAAQEAAAARGETVSEAVVRYLRMYARHNRKR